MNSGNAMEDTMENPNDDDPMAGVLILVFAAILTLYTFYIGLPMSGALICSVCWLSGAMVRLAEVAWLY